MKKYVYLFLFLTVMLPTACSNYDEDYVPHQTHIIQKPDKAVAATDTIPCNNKYDMEDWEDEEVYDLRTKP